MKSTWLSTLAIVAALAAAPAGAQETIKIGGIAPLSPPGGVQTGESLRDGMKIAVAEINAAGGLLGKKVELIVEDTSGVPEKGVAAFERLASKDEEIGRASCRERWCQYVEISVVAGTLKKKKHKKT